MRCNGKPGSPGCCSGYRGRTFAAEPGLDRGLAATTRLTSTGTQSPRRMKSM